MTEITPRIIKNRAQAVQVLHALRDYSDEREKAILMPEIRMIVESITTRDIDLLVPATKRLVASYMEDHGDFNGSIKAALSNDFNLKYN